MKRILSSVICLLLSFACFSQIPEKVKHIEIISNPADTMFLLDKIDIDKINTTFYKLECADSLNIINEEIISTLNIKNSKLDSIISEQKIIMSNKDVQINEIKTKNKDVISDLEKQLKRANNGKIF